MGTLGQYLRSAREARGIDLREAAQQTRISFNYLKALEEEDFSKLPGEVFVKGFLKNYGKFLHLDDYEVMKRFGEARNIKPTPSAGSAGTKAPAAANNEQPKPRSTAIEPFLWGAGIVVALMVLLFISLPDRHPRETHKATTSLSTGQTPTTQGPAVQTDKLYLEVVALEDTWLLVRTDNGPQKKALLKKGENLIWSANERFLLSYGSAKALKLVLNGQELTVNEPGREVVRDMIIVASGIVNRNIQPEKKLPQKKTAPAGQPHQTQPQENQEQTFNPETMKMQRGPLYDPFAPQSGLTPTKKQ